MSEDNDKPDVMRPFSARLEPRTIEAIEALGESIPQSDNRQGRRSVALRALLTPMVDRGIIARLLALPMPPRATLYDRVLRVFEAGLRACESDAATGISARQEHGQETENG